VAIIVSYGRKCSRNDDFRPIANRPILMNLPVKELVKSVCIYQSFGQEIGV